jgi:hypothetical protein
MPSSTVSPRRVILCVGSDAIFLRVARAPCLSTVRLLASCAVQE